METVSLNVATAILAETIGNYDIASKMLSNGFVSVSGMETHSEDVNAWASLLYRLFEVFDVHHEQKVLYTLEFEHKLETYLQSKELLVTEYESY